MNGARVARIGGVDVVADPSLIFLAALLTWSVFVELDDSFPDASSQSLALLALAGGVAFIGSVLIHELSHSLLAVRRGLRVRRIRLFVFGGVSEIEQEPRSPFEELSVSAAGPLSSAGLGAALYVVSVLLPVGPVQRLTWILAIANVALAIFNLLPGLPLDGGRVLRALLWKAWDDQQRASHWAILSGQALGIAVAVIGVGIILGRSDLAGLWLVAIGWFLLRAASGAKAREDLLGRVSGVAVRDVMRPVEVSVSGDLTVAELLDVHGFGDRMRAMPVTIDGRVRGIIGTREIEPLDADLYRFTLVSAVMSEIGPDDIVAVDASLEDLLMRSAGESGRAVVVEDGRVVGIVSGSDVGRVLG